MDHQTTPLSDGTIYHRLADTSGGQRVGLYQNKFEVSNFIRYKDMNGDAKCRKWGGLGWLFVTQGHRQCHHPTERNQRIRLPIQLRHYVSILHRLRDSQLFVESRRFLLTQRHLAPRLGRPRSIYLTSIN